MSEAPDGSDSDSQSSNNGRSTHDTDSRDNGGRHSRNHPNRVELKAHDLQVKVQSEGADLDDMCELASSEMESLMKHALRGEMEAIEREELSLFSLGDD